eukprot:CAMPEP_0177438598 /NCGR_PEP_ID=MMETSP0369-20130122/2846_1 /TAXON_ID=447022 ORGANISM="Scrippsiella hangoei-like, Strain SHHI-4" /NCGR_SAMPLE_ID=MMETSP0369 /ASSEMBLY_ACC=CAM_ASM_000364 /LENGTH=106 /DNA_ID=CAMNT_0018910187 /DNA_START=475 /DNA_END=796 /DNA_ORIENTATION=-
MAWPDDMLEERFWQVLPLAKDLLSRRPQEKADLHCLIQLAIQYRREPDTKTTPGRPLSSEEISPSAIFVAASPIPAAKSFQITEQGMSYVSSRPPSGSQYDPALEV